MDRYVRATRSSFTPRKLPKEFGYLNKDHSFITFLASSPTIVDSEGRSGN